MLQLHSDTQKVLTVCKKFSQIRLEILSTKCIYIRCIFNIYIYIYIYIYMYIYMSKQDLA